jgi:DNA-binding MarR family transcriptional regulator
MSVPVEPAETGPATCERAGDCPQLPERDAAAWFGFLHAHALLVKELDADLGRHGLSLSEHEVLVRLATAPEGRASISELAQTVVLSPSRVSRLVAKLELGGLVERQASDTDGRSTMAAITERGRERVAEAQDTHLDGIRSRFLDRLSDDDLERLAALWPRLTAGVPSCDE